MKNWFTFWAIFMALGFITWSIDIVSCTFFGIATGFSIGGMIDGIRDFKNNR